MLAPISIDKLDIKHLFKRMYERNNLRILFISLRHCSVMDSLLYIPLFLHHHI